MECLKCNFQNPEGIKFCGECGAKLEKICPECKSTNPAKFKFCGECGYDLNQSKEISHTINDKEPQSYTPKHLADKILTTRTSIEGERKLVTVLFADVANYTSISEKLDPEEVHQIMDGCFRILMNEIHKYEGTINQFTGDGVMALFGAPVSCEDHAQRACHAAIKIQNALEKYSKDLEFRIDTQFKMRVGINSGLVVVGSIGDDLRMDYTAVGDTTNLASRMENMAKPGAILLSENTQKLVKDFFELEFLGEIEIKGKGKLQKTFQLIKTGSVETRIGASVAKGLTRFVGRKNSIRMLSNAFEKVNGGSGQIVGIVGEAGVGKSRLLLEMSKMLPQGEFKYAEGRCLQYGGSVPYLPILDILRIIFSIKDADKEFLIKKKINDAVTVFGEQFNTLNPSFQDVLSLKVDDGEFIKLKPKEKREKIFEAIRDLLIRISQNKPLIIAVEDLHWIDKTSEEFLKYFIDWLANTQILLILLYRPEYTHQWGSKSFYTKIGVDQLDMDSSRELVKAILEEGEVAPELRQLILIRSAGNPLFMEEFTHTLIENGSIRKQDNHYTLKGNPEGIKVPDTIQGIIASRLDRLEDNLKKTLQVASVIGRDFAFRILQTITGMRNELKSNLLSLQGLEFIYEKNLFPELKYIFKHALTQEVAYNSLLQKRRKEIHEKIGIAIEQLYSDRLEEFYEMLAYHYCRSDNVDKSVQYSKLASKKAEKTASLDDAAYYIQKMIDNLEKIPATAEVNKQLIDARVTKGLFMYQLFDFVAAQEAIDPIVYKTNEISDKKRIAQIYTITGSYNFWVEENIPAAFNNLNKALIFAEEANDIVSQFFATMSLGQTSSYTGEFDRAFNCFDKVLEINTSLNNLWGISTVKCAISYLIYILQGKVASGIETSREAISFAEKSGDLYSLSGAYLSHGISNFYEGSFDNSMIFLSKAIVHCERINLLIYNSYAHYFQALNYFQMENFCKALTSFGEAFKLSKKSRLLPSFQNLIQVQIILTEIKNNKSDFNIEMIPDIIKSNQLSVYETSLYRSYSKILLSLEKDNFSAIEKWIFKAIEQDKKNRNIWNLAMDHVILAEFFLEKEQPSKALENFKISKSFFKETGANSWRDCIKMKIASL